MRDERKTAKLMIRIPPELHERLREAAQTEHRSVSNLIRHAIEEYLDNQ